MRPLVGSGGEEAPDGGAACSSENRKAGGVQRGWIPGTQVAQPTESRSKALLPAGPGHSRASRKASSPSSPSSRLASSRAHSPQRCQSGGSPRGRQPVGGQGGTVPLSSAPPRPLGPPPCHSRDSWLPCQGVRVRRRASSRNAGGGQGGPDSGSKAGLQNSVWKGEAGGLRAGGGTAWQGCPGHGQPGRAAGVWKSGSRWPLPGSALQTPHAGRCLCRPSCSGAAWCLRPCRSLSPQGPLPTPSPCPRGSLGFRGERLPGGPAPRLPLAGWPGPLATGLCVRDGAAARRNLQRHELAP